MRNSWLEKQERLELSFMTLRSEEGKMEVIGFTSQVRLTCANSVHMSRLGWHIRNYRT